MSCSSISAINECVIYSTISHILDYPLSLLLKYLITYPFYRGADLLYYLILKRYGSQAYYGEDNYHIIFSQPELTAIYILSGENIHVPINIKDPTRTIYSQVRTQIDVINKCPQHKLRNSVITAEASIKDAIGFPWIALNYPQYQKYFKNNPLDIIITKLLISCDWLEPITKLNYETFFLMIDRMTYLQLVAPNLWKMSLQKYYQDRLLLLDIYNFIPFLTCRHIIVLTRLFPDIIPLPSNLSSLGLRLWFCNRITRAYLLGFDIFEGIPSDADISQAIYKLSQEGIENYVNDITGINLDSDHNLTGKIGNNFYPELTGKKLLNTRDELGRNIGSYYSTDLVPIFTSDGVHILTIGEILDKIENEDQEITVDVLRSLFEDHKFKDLTEIPSPDQIQNILDRLSINIEIPQSIPVRIRLTEINATDNID